MAVSAAGRAQGFSSARFEITGGCDIRLVRPKVARLVSEEGQVRLYHCADNAKVYRGEVPQYMVFEEEQVDALEHLLKSCDEWFPVCSIPGLNLEAAIGLATVLYELGIILVREDNEAEDEEL